MAKVRAKKNLGQHFLKDENIASDIAHALTLHKGYKHVLEIGPGMGVLTKYLLKNDHYSTKVYEIDSESVQYLVNELGMSSDDIIEGDFLQANLKEVYQDDFALIGNYPYNISSQIFFKVLEYRDQIPEVVGMLQKEVAQRLTSGPGTKNYGILSVLLQAYYIPEYLFDVDEHVFDPPPKVKSGVIRMKRNDVQSLPCNEKVFKRIVKQAFNMRRKTLRNALKSLNLPEELTQQEVFAKRAEQLSVDQFIALTQSIEKTL